MLVCMKIDMEVFHKLTVSFLLVIARYAQSTKNFCDFFKKKLGIKLIFLHTDKHQTFLQVGLIDLGGNGHASYPK